MEELLLGKCKDVRNNSEYFKFGLFSYIYDGTVGHVMSRYVFPLFSYESCIESCIELCYESCIELYYGSFM